MPIQNCPKYVAWFQEQIKHKTHAIASPTPQYIDILHIPSY